MSLKYFIEEILLIDPKDKIEVSPNHEEWVDWETIKNDDEIASRDIVNISCDFNSNKIWSIWLW